MIDQTVLPDLMRRESRSFLQYVREAFPYARGKDMLVRDAILRIANTEAVFTASIGTMLQQRHIPTPSLGAFPSSFTGSNFLAVMALLPRIVASERQALADLVLDLTRIDDAEFRAKLESYRDLKRTHLTELESLAA